MTGPAKPTRTHVTDLEAPEISAMIAARPPPKGQPSKP
jgi:hypothetical protein